MITCNPENHFNGSSRLEFFECRDGLNWYICKDCGELVFIGYHDSGCGA